MSDTEASSGNAGSRNAPSGNASTPSTPSGDGGSGNTPSGESGSGVALSNDDAQKAGAPEAAPQEARRSRVAWGIATLLGLGYSQPGSGTKASAVTVALWLAIASWAPGEATRAWWTLGVAAVITAIGIAASTVVARESGQRDPGFVVIDEVAGQLIALMIAPARWQYALISFILFRGLDIFKPPPLRALEKLRGGWGIMLDDVGAGLYALGLIELWLRVTHYAG